jgi:hypothetical protein
MRKLIMICAILALSMSVPVTTWAEVSVTYTQGYLYVNDAEGKTLEIVSLTGRKVMEEQINSPAQKIELSIPKGCYIVKVGSVVRKISVR